MQKLIAKKTVKYGGQRYEAGDTFEAKKKDARLLLAIGKVEKAESDVEAPAFVEDAPKPRGRKITSVKEVVEPEPAPEPIVPVEEAAQDTETPAETTEPDAD